MEEMTTKELLEQQIKTCIEGLKYTEQGEEQHARLVGDIERLTKAYAELEKLDASKADSDRRFLEEIRQKDLDRDYKDILERTRLVEEKKSGWRDAGIRIAGIVMPLALYGVFLGLGMRLEFIDHGNVTGFTVKELFRVLHPKTPMV